MAAVAVVAAAPGAASAAYRAETPPARTLTYDGPTGRYQLDGTWLLRPDTRDEGLKSRWYRSGSTKGWRAVTAPNAYNAGDDSELSMGGYVAWYRKDFRLPRAQAGAWILHFESVRHRATVWLNGQQVGTHRGDLAWELNLRGAKKGVNHLVVRVDDRLQDTDLPPSRTTLEGQPSGGWWNWGGLIRDIYLRRVQGLDIAEVQVLPRLPCRTCAAQIDYRVTVRNYGRKPAHVRASSTYGHLPVRLGSATIPAGSSHTFTASPTLAGPHLWSPNDPHLYPVAITAQGGGRAGYKLMSGVRSIAVQNGRLLLNGLPVDFRGVFLHEDDPATGAAVTPQRMQLFVDRAKQLGATVLRTHYPLNPYLHELADRNGLMIWSEIPVFQIPTKTLAKPEVQAYAAQLLHDNIIQNGNHPSVLAWSLGNELAPDAPAPVARWLRTGAALAHRLDPTRPVALAILGYPTVSCRPEQYAPIDLLGVNTYFGWYPGPEGSIADRDELSGFLDQVRGCYPRQAIAVTEFGAEANRHGPPEERGTYEFQSEINDFDLGVYAQKPWLSGAVGMLMDFWARPGWMGGNPYSTPPIHQKGVFDFAGNPKPAAEVLSRWFHSTQQYDLPGP